MTHVYVAPGTRMRGVMVPGAIPRGAKGPTTSDWRQAPGTAGNTRGVRPTYQRRRLADALGASYDTDAHLVTYSIIAPDGVPLERQPRVCKDSLEWLDEQGYQLACDVLLADIDNPDHKIWSPCLRTEFDQLWASAPAPIETAGIYMTAHGLRLVQPLDEPVAVPDVERYLQGWLDEIAAMFKALGVAWEPDLSCVDFTRHFRLPHVKRGVTHYRSPLVDLTRMRPRVVVPKCCAGTGAAGANTRIAA